MCLFRNKDDTLIAKEEDKDLARVALNRAKAKAVAARNTKIGWILALVILLVAGLRSLIPQSVPLPYLVLSGVILWLVLTIVITLALEVSRRRDVREEYEKQLLELKVLTRK